MILGGYLPQTEHLRQLGEVSVTLTIDTSQFVQQISRVSATLIRLDFELETSRLNAHQVEAMMYVRGAFDPEFTDPEARDHYVRALLSGGTNHPGHAIVGAVAFLTGWSAFHSDDKPEPLAWHRLIGDNAIEVSAA